MILAEEEISDVSLSTFYVFDKENAGARSIRLAARTRRVRPRRAAADEAAADEAATDEAAAEVAEAAEEEVAEAAEEAAVSG